jgi:hypothetical protein
MTVFGVLIESKDVSVTRLETELIPRTDIAMQAVKATSSCAQCVLWKRPDFKIATSTCRSLPIKHSRPQQPAAIRHQVLQPAKCEVGSVVQDHVEYSPRSSARGVLCEVMLRRPL